MKKEYIPFVSVVVCTFNRSAYLELCLESLHKQTYPRDHYEVIIIDDGSTDPTAGMVDTEQVQLIRHKINKGLPAARNTGIAAAKGEIVAFIDDDATANPDWLEHLIRPFEDPTISASGGRTFAYKIDRLAERYLAADEYGNPAPLEFGKSKNPFWRFWVYFKSMFVPVSIATTPTEVQAVFGLNCAYRASALKTFGGFDESLVADEDSEISVRFRSSGAHIMFVPDAIIRHRHRESIYNLIRQTYYRAESTFYAYKKEKKMPPVFPLPLLYIVIAICLSLLKPATGITFLIIGPILLYIWWPVRAFREHALEYFIYAYIQLLLELAAAAGLIRGKFRSIMKAH